MKLCQLISFVDWNSYLNFTRQRRFTFFKVCLKWLNQPKKCVLNFFWSTFLSFSLRFYSAILLITFAWTLTRLINCLQNIFAERLSIALNHFLLYFLLARFLISIIKITWISLLPTILFHVPKFSLLIGLSTNWFMTIEIWQIWQIVSQEISLC